MHTVMIIMTIVLAVVIILAGLRFFRLRGQGTRILIRTLPADSPNQWRHSVLIYSWRTAQIFKLRSLRLGPDIVLSRQGVEIKGRRPLTVAEEKIISPESHVLNIQESSHEYEIAITQADDNAFVSWLESQPSARQHGLNWR